MDKLPSLPLALIPWCTCLNSILCCVAFQLTEAPTPFLVNEDGVQHKFQKMVGNKSVILRYCQLAGTMVTLAGHLGQCSIDYSNAQYG